MRSVGDLMSQMLDRQNLLLSVERAGRGRRYQPEVMAYSRRLDQELITLRRVLADGQPQCGHCNTFTIYDPKERLITAPVFRERVLHHAVMAVCAPEMEKRLIHHTYACRVGKGTFRALETARRVARSSTWFVKMDIRQYFASIPRDRMLLALRRVFREARVNQIFEVLLHSYGAGGHGLPIGTLVSQHLANYYLSVADTFILQELRPEGYVRYMDDMVLWCGSPEQASTFLNRTAAFLDDHLGLELKTGFFNKTARGMDFLGHRVFPHRLTLSAARRRRFGHSAAVLQGLWATGEISESTAQERGTALVAATERADTKPWRQRVFGSITQRSEEQAVTDFDFTPEGRVWCSDVGELPQAGTASCVAAAGSTTAGMPDPPTATAGCPTTATTTLASAPAPAGRRGTLVEPVAHPAPSAPSDGQTQSLPPLAGNPHGQQARANANGGSVGPHFSSSSLPF